MNRVIWQRGLALVVVALSLLAFTTGLYAADTETAPASGEVSEHATDGSGDHAEGEHDVLPQLDTATYPSQIFWLIILFLFLYWLMKTKALPRVAEILEARQDRIANDLDKAAMYRRDAEKALEQYEAAVAEAQSEAAAQIQEVHDLIASEHAEKERALDAELASKIQKAEAEIASARNSAMAEINNVAIDAARMATQKLAGIDVTEDEARAALGRVTNEAA